MKSLFFLKYIVVVFICDFSVHFIIFKFTCPHHFSLSKRIPVTSNGARTEVSSWEGADGESSVGNNPHGWLQTRIQNASVLLATPIFQWSGLCSLISEAVSLGLTSWYGKNTIVRRGNVTITTTSHDEQDLSDTFMKIIVFRCDVSLLLLNVYISFLYKYTWLLMLPEADLWGSYEFPSNLHREHYL